jgi:adenine phosphoribosyltransferase
LNFKDYIRAIPDWPEKGVVFRDITPLLQSPTIFREVCDVFLQRYSDKKIDKVVGIDARGFILSAVIAYELSVGFVPARKKGKLPFKSIVEPYSLEYGSQVLEMHEDAICQDDRVLIVDDLIATGGTLEATTKLVKKLGGCIVECACIIELKELNGAAKIKRQHDLFSLLSY